MNGLIAYILSKKFTKGHFKGGTNITLTDNADGTVSINASGEVSSEDAYAREQIATHIADDENPHSVTAEQIGAYVKNDDGIPYDDLSNSVQTSLGLADSALQSHQNISGKEDKTNKVTAWSDELSDTRYPSEKLVKDSLDNKVDKIYGKGLSANDYTNADKTLVSTIEDKIDKEDIVSTYSSEGTSPVNGKAIADALDSLDVSSIGGVEKYIKSISEENGKVSAVTGTIDSVLVSNSQSSNLVTSNAIAAFVNSSIATNTANYISNNGQPFTSFEQLQAYSGTKTNNDYAFVKKTDESGNTIYIRYKYNDNDQSWNEEYVLNNSSFTEAQWTTISSGLSSLDKTKLDGIESGANKTVVDSSLSSSSTNPVQNKKVYEALQGKYDVQTNGIPKSDLSSDVRESLELANTALQSHQDISGKEDKSNKVSIINASSTTTQYPNAKAVYNTLNDITRLLSTNVLYNNVKPQTFTVPGASTNATINSNGSVTLAGTTPSGQNRLIIQNLFAGIRAGVSVSQTDFKKWLKNGDYVIINNIYTKARLQVYGYTTEADMTSLTSGYGQVVNCTITDEYPYNMVRLTALPGVEFNNDVVYPLIVPKEIYDYYDGNVSYEKPLMHDTIRYLEEKIDALSQRVAALEA